MSEIFNTSEVIFQSRRFSFRRLRYSWEGSGIEQESEDLQPRENFDSGTKCRIRKRNQVRFLMFRTVGSLHCIPTLLMFTCLASFAIGFQWSPNLHLRVFVSIFVDNDRYLRFCRIELDTREAKSTIRFEAFRNGSEQSIVVSQIVEESEAWRNGVRVGHQILAISDPVRPNEMWEISSMSSGRFVRDALRTRVSAFVCMVFDIRCESDYTNQSSTLVCGLLTPFHHQSIGLHTSVTWRTTRFNNKNKNIWSNSRIPKSCTYDFVQ